MLLEPCHTREASPRGRSRLVRNAPCTVSHTMRRVLLVAASVGLKIKFAIAKSTREREKERQLAAQKQQEAALAMDDLNQQRLRQMTPATVAMKKQEDLHRMETDELYCQLIVLRKNQSQLLEDLMALHVQKDSLSAQMSPEKMLRKLQEMLCES